VTLPSAHDADLPQVALALQGGGTHGAFTWGVLDRLLDDVEARRLRLAGFSGASAGAINAALCAMGLAIGGPREARERLRLFWTDLSRQGRAAGNAFFGFADPGLFGFDIDWSPGAILLEMMGLVVSPYANPFYVDALAPLLRSAFRPEDLARLNAPGAPPVFVTATNIGTNERRIFTRPELTVEALQASAALPTEFKATEIGDAFYWDGGYLGNPALNPLLDVSKDLLLVLINPLHFGERPPFNARQIQDRLNQIIFNASVVLELNAVEAVNRVLAAIGGPVEKPGGGRYEAVRVHLIRNDRFMEGLGFVSKQSTSWALLEALFRAGRHAAEAWLAQNRERIGVASSADLRVDLLRVLAAPGF
jgi:NTE family protein